MTDADASLDDADLEDAGLDLDGIPDAGDTECFTDSFTGSAIDAARWTAGAMPPAMVDQTNGVLRFSLGTSSALAYAGLESAVRDFTNDAIEIEVVAVPSVTTTAELAISVQIDQDDRYLYLVTNGSIKARKVDGGITTPDVSRSYGIGDRYLRIRFSGTQVFWETSANRVTWSTDRTATIPAPTSRYIELSAGTYDSIASPGGAKLDNFALICAP